MGGHIWKYIALFAGAVVVQTLLLDNLGLGLYIVPQIYILPVAMLPSRTAPAAVMLWAFLLGVVIDLLSGTAGLNVIAVLCTAFARPLALRAIFGAALVREGMVPLPDKVGAGRVLRYLSLLLAIHFVVYFLFETLTFHYIWLTLVKIILSGTVSVGLCYLGILLFWGRRNVK